MSAVEKLKETAEKSKKIEALRQSEKYKTQAKEIEQLDLKCRMEIYSLMVEIHNERRKQLTLLKDKYEAARDQYNKVTVKLNHTIDELNSDPEKYAKIIQHEADPAVVNQYKEKIADVKKNSDAIVRGMESIQKKYNERSLNLHLSFFNTYDAMLSLVGKKKRSLSVTKQLNPITQEELERNRMKYSIKTVDSTYRNLYSIHSQRKFDSQYAKQAPSMASIALNRSHHGSQLLSSVSSSQCPEIIPSDVKCNIFDETKQNAPQQHVWGYIPTLKSSSTQIEINTKTFHFLEGSAEGPILFHPYSPWTKLYMKEEECYLGYDSVLGIMVLTICPIINTKAPPEGLSDKRGGLMCTIKTSKGEARGIIEKNLVFKQKYNLQLITSTLDSTTSNIKFKLLDNSSKPEIHDLLLKFDDVNAPTQFDVCVRYINTNSPSELIEDSEYPKSFDSFLNSIAKATEISQTQRIYRKIKSKISYQIHVLLSK
ncbi:SH3 domain-containing protein [Entamoeba marina]